MRDDREIFAISRALDEEIFQITDEIKNVGLIYRIDELDEPVLDFLAFQFHVDFYDLAADIESKRSMVKNSLKWHMKKGTSYAIIEALKMIGIDAEFLHWHDWGGEPYSFKIRATITGDYYRTAGRDKIIARIRQAVNDSKAARSYFEGLETKIFFSENISPYFANIPLLSGQEIIKLAQYDFDESGKLYYGLANARQGYAKISPDRDKEISQKIYAGVIKFESISQEVGIDIEIMQELLLKFEDRIFTRMDNLQSEVNAAIQGQNVYIASRFDELCDLLRWKGDDEPLA